MIGWTRDISELTSRLVELEQEISDLRAQQVVVINELNKGQAHLTDASRNLTEYIQSHLDVSPETAKDLVFAGTTFPFQSSVHDRLIGGGITFDRALATVAYIVSGASDDDVAESDRLDIEDVRRRTSARKRMTRSDERSIHGGRFVTTQPTLDRSRYRIWGELPGYEGSVVEKAIAERGDEFQRLSPDVESGRGQRNADALVAMAHDSLDRPERSPELGDANSTGGPSVTVFVDATQEHPAESTAQVEFGPRVGPDTLETILCEGSVRVVGMNGGRPVRVSRAARAIPPAIRHHVAYRDGGCTIRGCRSRYRLQPHHITPWSRGGTHDPDNLTTLCWYHHHVAIHRSGFAIDPDSPPLRRRLVKSPIRSGADPP